MRGGQRHGIFLQRWWRQFFGRQQQWRVQQFRGIKPGVIVGGEVQFATGQLFHWRIRRIVQRWSDVVVRAGQQQCRALLGVRVVFVVCVPIQLRAAVLVVGATLIVAGAVLVRGRVLVVGDPGLKRHGVVVVGPGKLQQPGAIQQCAALQFVGGCLLVRGAG